MTPKPSYLHWPILFAVFAFFSLGLIFNKLVNISFYLLILFALITLLRPNAPQLLGRLCKQYWPLFLAMCGMVGAIFVQQLFTDQFKAATYDYPSRLAFFFLLFWLFVQLRADHLTFTKWAWVIGVIAGTIQLFFMPKDANGRPDMPVWYIELVMLLAIFSFISIGWNKPHHKQDLRKIAPARRADASQYGVRQGGATPLERFCISPDKFSFITQTSLQIIAGACGTYAAYISETRGVWIAIPFFLLMMFASFFTSWYSRKNLALFAIAVLAMGMLFTTTGIAQKRIEAAKENLLLYSAQKDKDTSIGVRLQVWQASWLVFKQNPIFGVGKNHYSDAMNVLAKNKVITPGAAAFFHSHNEILYNMMTLGIFGLIGILLIYLVPAYYFAKELLHDDRAIRASAAMGLSLCIGFMIFGLVDVMLLYKTTDVFYSVAAALLLAHIANRKKELAIAANLT